MKKRDYLFALIVPAIVCWPAISFLWGSLGPGELIISTIIGWLAASILVLVARKVSHSVWIYIELLILAGLLIPDSLFVKIFPASLSEPFGSLMALTLLSTLSMALVIAALLLYSGLNLHKKWRNADEEDGISQAQRKHAARASVVAIVLSALLLAKAIHNFYWFMVWDTTFDPLGHLWSFFPVLAVLFSAALLFITLPGRTKLAGFLYLLLIPALIAVSARAQSVDFRQLTKERAESVSQAIETYYTQEGCYPRDLRQLIPWYIFSLPEPVIIYGQGWCYDGGGGYYRLGYVYREHWSDPRLTGQIYKTKGEVSDLQRICDKEIATLQKRYPQYYVDGE